jgi:hypothetical protein
MKIVLCVVIVFNVQKTCFNLKLNFPVMIYGLFKKKNKHYVLCFVLFFCFLFL